VLTAPEGNANVTAWPSNGDAVGTSWRGGSYVVGGVELCISDRTCGTSYAGGYAARDYGNGFRAVRTAP